MTRANQESGERSLRPIAHMQSDFATKFGIPRQSGVVESLRSRVVFTPEFRNPDALRGLADFSYIWLIWGFSEALRGAWSPTVRPPLLGGNTRMGVFATRSPFRPNGLGLSSVALDKIETTSEFGVVLWVCGADLMDGTPIYDIKPYLPYTDSHPEAAAGFAASAARPPLKVYIEENLLQRVPEEKRASLLEVLGDDPRPSYQQDDARAYGMEYAGFEVKFRVEGDALRVFALYAIEA